MEKSSKNIQHRKERVLMSINPKIYPLEVIHAAAYSMIDRAYVILDGDPAEEIIVELIPKDKKCKKDIELEFSNELLNYAVYYNQARMNKEARDSIIKRVFSTHDQTSEISEEPAAEDVEKPEVLETVEDPLGIAKPWTPKNKKVDECKE
ncbi:hypothetical protein H0N99_01680 [Candidatus Micrarchaeota archaeon]|nr:hypothetical protein [Candidatus Micrarchaeota archaeon]